MRRSLALALVLHAVIIAIFMLELPGLDYNQSTVDAVAIDIVEPLELEGLSAQVQNTSIELGREAVLPQPTSGSAALLPAQRLDALSPVSQARPQTPIKTLALQQALKSIPEIHPKLEPSKAYLPHQNSPSHAEAAIPSTSPTSRKRLVKPDDAEKQNSEPVRQVAATAPSYHFTRQPNALPEGATQSSSAQLPSPQHSLKRTSKENRSTAKNSSSSSQSNDQHTLNSMINQLTNNQQNTAFSSLIDSPGNGTPSSSRQLGNGHNTAVKLSEGQMNRVRSAVRQCWNVDIGGKAQNTVVEIRVRYQANHQIEVLGIENEDRATSDPGFQAAAEAARRAVLNPLCLNQWPDLPPNEYILRFNPSDMFVAG